MKGLFSHLVFVAFFQLTTFSMLASSGQKTTELTSAVNFSTSYTKSQLSELVIGVPNFNMKRYEEVISIISQTDGVLKVTYCESLQVFLIQFDSSKIHSAEDLFTIMEKSLHEFQLFHKVGKSIDELKGLC
ncbi:MAG: hypothetical protein V4638_02990 [Bacteroidota bacterium]